MEQGFVSDIYLPHMLYAHTIRSPVAKGKLKSVKCTNLPDGCTLISAKDIPGKNYLEETSMPVLADDELSYIGEPVALLLGPSKVILEECSKNCEVITEEEMPVFSIRDARDDMIAVKRDFRIGDPNAAFADAASVVNGIYNTGIQEHWYSEPSGAVAWLEQTEESPKKKMPKKGKSITVCTATQWPYHVKRSVAQILGFTPSSVLVKPALTGLHMDGRLWYPSLLACHAALGTWLTKQPVRLFLTREEDFSFSPKRFGTEISITSALSDQGELLGVDIHATVNLGAYEVNIKEVLDNIYHGCLGVYKTKNIQFSGVALKTNIPPQGGFAGFGHAEGFFTVEQHVSQLAESSGRDLVQWRIDNFFNPVKDSVSGDQLLKTVINMSDYHRKSASYEHLRENRKQRVSQDTSKGEWMEKGESLRGIGLAIAYQSSGFMHKEPDKNNYYIELVLDKDGSLEIKTSLISSCNDYEDLWAGIASDILGLDKKMVRINCSVDSPDSGPSTASRNITILTPMVEQACIAIRKQRFKYPLPISVRKTIRPQKTSLLDSEKMGLDNLAKLGWASTVVEVEVDPIEYIPNIRSVWMSINGGKIISEERARRSLKTSIIQALGWAYRERINYINGAIPAGQFENFDIPGPSEIPPIYIDFIGSSLDEPKGIGDLPFSCVPAAYMQAVSQAMDHHFHSIPLKTMDIWFALMKKRGSA